MIDRRWIDIHCVTDVFQWIYVILTLVDNGAELYLMHASTVVVLFYRQLYSC